MKNKILGIAFCSVGLLATTSCGDYLETSSPSTTTSSVVSSSADNCQSTLNGAYIDLHDVMLAQVYGAGLFYALDVAGSDIERHPGENVPLRWQPETFYNGGNASVLAAYNPISYGKESPSSAYAMLMSIIQTANTLIDGISEAQLEGDNAKAYKRIIAECICMKATCYRELIKYYGDVPLRNHENDPYGQFTSRLEIYDSMLSQLAGCADNLADITASNKNTFTKQYAYALIGRLSLEAAGYQTYRLDVTEASKLEKHPDYTDAQNATYARPTNYKAYYDKAYDAFKWVTTNMGGIVFDANDYSTFFTQLHQNTEETGFADESIFEDVQKQGASGNCERPYSIGRPSSGGSSKAFPCKSYGQCHINTAFYYGVFDPKDVRRDVSCAVTGSDGKGFEKVIPYDFNTTANGGGMACGKFDENRQSKVWTANQRRAGINAPYMRISEVYLGLAEAALMKTTPDMTTAVDMYNKTHERAGLGKANNVTLEAIVDERGFEFAAEGDRRWNLIRTGFIGKKIEAIKVLTANMVKGLKSNGYYEFDNGNVISNTIYTKMVDPKALGLSSRVTPVTPASMRVGGYEPKNDLEAVQLPGWRGQHDWENVSGFSNYKSNSKSNVAIRGLFSKLSAEEIATLKAAGYKEQAWGSKLADQEDIYSDGIFEGWNYKSAPIYLFPHTTNALLGGLTNGYGFSSSF